MFKDVVNYFKYEEENLSVNVNYTYDDITKEKEDYRIEISQDGKFAVSFDTGKN
jgi:hypothetical protein